MPRLPDVPFSASEEVRIMGVMQNLRSNRTAVFVIAGILIVIVIICMVVAVSALSRAAGSGDSGEGSADADAPAAPAGPTATPLATPDPDILTAREAYVAAVEVIRAADPGAILASAAGAWTPNVVAPNVIAGRTGWTFHFFLPATSELATVLVERGGTARIASREAWDDQPSLIDDQGWQVDSGEAVLRALEQCQVTVIPAELSVKARLTLAASAGSVRWRVSVDEQGQDTCIVLIDATTGAVRQ
jgi:hypothetical protein